MPSEIRKRAPLVVDLDGTSDRSIVHAQRLATILDSAFTIPGTKYTFGFDGLLSLIPGIGDALGTGLSTYILYVAAKAGVPLSGLLRMTGNIVADQMLGTLPVLGDLFDFTFKSNRRNAFILTQALLAKSSLIPRTNSQLRLLVGTITVFLIGMFLISILLTVYILGRLIF